jgi:hypothetical protein
MTVTVQLINKLNDVGSKCEKLKTAEKAEAIEIRTEANALFQVCAALIEWLCATSLTKYIVDVCRHATLSLALSRPL